MRRVEARLLNAVETRSHAPAHATADNISLPSPPPGTTPTSSQRLTTVTSTPSLPASTSASAQVQQPPIPDKVRQRILRDEYVDFDTLLPESLYPARYGVSSAPAFTLRLSNDTSAEDGDVVIVQPKPATKRSICDLTSWIEAWNLYAQVLVTAFLDRAPALLAYQTIICSASSGFPPRLWLHYDQRFRASAASDTTLHWDVRNNELWLECFTQASAAHGQAPSSRSARRPCTYCGSLYHYPDNCASHPFRRRNSPPRSKTSLPASQTSLPATTAAFTPPQSNNQPLPHPCRDFNNGSCRRHTCRFRHICAKCNEQGHRERERPASR